MDKGAGKSSSNKIIDQDEQELVPGKQLAKCESCLPKGQARLQVFFLALILISCLCEVTYLTGLLELLEVRELSEQSELMLRFLDFLAFCKIIS